MFLKTRHSLEDMAIFETSQNCWHLPEIGAAILNIQSHDQIMKMRIGYSSVAYKDLLIYIVSDRENVF